MSSANLGWLFYKDYFDDINYHDLKSQQNEDNINKKVENIINQKPTISKQGTLGNITFEATTTYPGLLLGSGTTHELPEVKSQAILGFHFDYTTGLPIIAGSSIKGVLRSAFKHSEYIQELLKEKNINLSKEEIKKLEVEVFGQENGDKEVSAGKDIFFDATLVGVLAGGKILNDDYITPHKNRKKIEDEKGNLLADELFDPIPLRFIKVLGGVKFKFDFELQDSIIKKEDKATLFTQILIDLGVGAKTNVGYGKLDIKTTFIPDDDPLEKLLKLHEYNAVKLLQAYDNGITDIDKFKDEFVKALLAILEKDLKKAKSKFRGKVEKRIARVQSKEF